MIWPVRPTTRDIIVPIETNAALESDSDQSCCAGHHHGLTSEGAYDGLSDSRLLWSVVLNQLLTVIQVVTGVISGSVSLLSDAAHNFSDANSLLIAYVARRVSRRDADVGYTFGYGRAELIGATINLTLLGATGFYLVCEAIHRFYDPQPIIGWLMAVAAVVAIVVDLATAAFLWAMSKGSINVRAAFVHNLVDAAGSVAVLIGAIAIIQLDWTWVDPTLSLLIAGYIFWQVKTMLPQAIQILMEATPLDVDLKHLSDDLRSVEHVCGIHHVHLWALDERRHALEAHVVIEPSSLSQIKTIKAEIKSRLANRYQVHHSTLEFELTDERCHDDDNQFQCHAQLLEKQLFRK